MTETSEVRSPQTNSEIIKCANCSGPLNSESQSDSLESAVLAFDSFVQNRHVRVTLRNALDQVFGVTDLEECHFCVHCCLIFSQLYGLFHLLGARRREDALLASKLKELRGIIIEPNFESLDDQVKVEVSDADGLVSFWNVSDPIDFDPDFISSEPEDPEQDDSRSASPVSNHETSTEPRQRDDLPFGEVIDPDGISSAILQHVTEYGQRILYKCCNCQEGFLNLQNFINHRLSSHPSLSSTELFKCIVCSEVCKEGTDFRDHLFSHCRSAKRKLYPVCDICGRRFVAKQLVQNHYNVAHVAKEKTENKRKRIGPLDYKCSDCGEVFKGVRKYKAHRRALHPWLRRKQQNEWTNGVSEIPSAKQTDDDNGGEIRAGHSDDTATTSCGFADPSATDAEADYDDINDADDERLNYTVNDDTGNAHAAALGFESDESEDSASSSKEDEDSPKLKRTRLDTSSLAAPSKPPSKSNGKIRPTLKYSTAASKSSPAPAKTRAKRQKPKPTFHCNDCNLSLTTAAEVGSHKRNKHGIALKAYQCHQCPSAFNYASCLEGHMIRMHMKERPFECRKCSASFPLLESLKRHMKNKHMELLITRFGSRRDKEFSDIYKRIYLCADCDDRFEEQDSYIGHAKSVHGRIHQCPQCLSLYPSISLLKTHMEAHERSLECDFCDKSFSDQRGLTLHMTTSHADGRGGESELPEEAIKDAYEPERDLLTDEFHCPACTERFDKPKEVVEHITTTHPERLMCWCPLCEAKALNLTHLKEHLRAAHKLSPCPYCSLLSKHLPDHKKNYHRAEMEQEKVIRVTRVSSKKCRKESTQQRLHDRDQRLVAAGEIVYKCADCDMNFALAKTYRDHRTEAHPREPIYKCHLCLHTNNAPSRFHAHLGTHNESDDWPCGQPECARRFLNRRRRDEHLREAHGIKKHTDDYYPLPYSQSIKLITGEMKRTTRAEVPTNYNCVDCGAEFMVFTDLGKHRRELHKVSEGKEWVCHVCKKVMRSSNSLSNHMSRHKDAKEYMCDECGKCFRNKADLFQHRKLNHDPVGREKLKEVWRKSRERRKLAKAVEDYDSSSEHSKKQQQQVKTEFQFEQAESSRTGFGEDESSIQHNEDDGGTEDSVTFALFGDDVVVG